ncbi:hypothetical protein MTR_4g077270 [Medicago truncatula]|uniref:Uncharacterized protein n=1 Tax=Medicago truncatula TaxID=3880 RepID=A0A072ULR0_MEDTR|nr:hypothetical protein MTR_4g077270 [Medicago truncatula]
MLENLETLDLTYTMFYAMPKEICKLRKLRHFLGLSMSWIQLKDGLGGMTFLQTLREVYLCLQTCQTCCPSMSPTVIMKRNLKGAVCSLKKLKLFVIPELKMLPTCIQHLQKLQVLRVESMSVKFMQSIAPVKGKEYWIFKQVPFVETYG